jgi:hypothetical protein
MALWTKSGDRRDVHHSLAAGGPFKPSFGLSGEARSWAESSCSSFVFSFRLFRVDLYFPHGQLHVCEPSTSPL